MTSKTSKKHTVKHKSARTANKKAKSSVKNARPITHPSTIHHVNVTINQSNQKTCQEVEVGDIGGFGDVQELEHHQKQCGDVATEYCSTCGKNLCRIHYMLLHGDHSSYDNRHSASLA